LTARNETNYVYRCKSKTSLGHHCYLAKVKYSLKLYFEKARIFNIYQIYFIQIFYRFCKFEGKEQPQSIKRFTLRNHTSYSIISEKPTFPVL